MTAQQEKKNRTKAMIISLGVHGALVLLLLFIVAWRAPNPPHPEYGIELNFGMDDQGTGEIQPQVPVGTDETEETEELQESPEETSTPEQTEAVTEKATPAETVPVDPEVISKVESPEVVEEKKEEIKPVEKPVEKPLEKATETKKEVKPKETPKAVYQPNTKSDTEGTAATKAGETGSQGDSKNKTGDKGDPEGSLDAKALYGKQGGGGGGPSLDLAGWDWDHIPEPKTPENETSGRIVFTIEVDENGDLIRYRKESGTVSAAAERACIAAIQNLTFTKKSGAKVPEVSKGKITFVIRAE